MAIRFHFCGFRVLISARFFWVVFFSSLSFPPLTFRSMTRPQYFVINCKRLALGCGWCFHFAHGVFDVQAFKNYFKINEMVSLRALPVCPALPHCHSLLVRPPCFSVPHSENSEPRTSTTASVVGDRRVDVSQISFVMKLE